VYSSIGISTTRLPGRRAIVAVGERDDRGKEEKGKGIVKWGGVK